MTPARAPRVRSLECGQEHKDAVESGGRRNLDRLHEPAELDWVGTRSAIGTVLAVLFCVLVAVDPLVCSDGCREEGGQVAPPAGSSCVSCVGLSPVMSHYLFDSDESALNHAEITGVQPEQLFLLPLEHPPQST